VRLWNPTRSARAISACAAPGDRRTPKLASIPCCCCDWQAEPEAAPVCAVAVGVVAFPAAAAPAPDASAWLEELPHPAAKTAAQPAMAIAAI
jgi:hypothetical protein